MPNTPPASELGGDDDPSKDRYSGKGLLDEVSTLVDAATGTDEGPGFWARARNRVKRPSRPAGASATPAAPDSPQASRPSMRDISFPDSPPLLDRLRAGATMSKVEIADLSFTKSEVIGGGHGVKRDSPRRFSGWTEPEDGTPGEPEPARAPSPASEPGETWFSGRPTDQDLTGDERAPAASPDHEKPPPPAPPDREPPPPVVEPARPEALDLDALKAAYVRLDAIYDSAALTREPLDELAEQVGDGFANIEKVAEDLAKSGLTLDDLEALDAEVLVALRADTGDNLHPLFDRSVMLRELHNQFMKLKVPGWDATPERRAIASVLGLSTSSPESTPTPAVDPIAPHAPAPPHGPAAPAPPVAPPTPAPPVAPPPVAPPPGPPPPAPPTGPPPPTPSTGPPTPTGPTAPVGPTSRRPRLPTGPNRPGKKGGGVDSLYPFTRKPTQSSEPYLTSKRRQGESDAAFRNRTEPYGGRPVRTITRAHMPDEILLGTKNEKGVYEKGALSDFREANKKGLGYSYKNWRGFRPDADTIDPNRAAAFAEGNQPTVDEATQRLAALTAYNSSSLFRQPREKDIKDAEERLAKAFQLQLVESLTPHPPSLADARLFLQNEGVDLTAFTDQLIVEHAEAKMDRNYLESRGLDLDEIGPDNLISVIAEAQRSREFLESEGDTDLDGLDWEQITLRAQARRGLYQLVDQQLDRAELANAALGARSSKTTYFIHNFRTNLNTSGVIRRAMRGNPRDFETRVLGVAGDAPPATGKERVAKGLTLKWTSDDLRLMPQTLDQARNLPNLVGADAEARRGQLIAAQLSGRVAQDRDPRKLRMRRGILPIGLRQPNRNQAELDTRTLANLMQAEYEDLLTRLIPEDKPDRSVPEGTQLVISAITGRLRSQLEAEQGQSVEDRRRNRRARSRRLVRDWREYRDSPTRTAPN